MDGCGLGRSQPLLRASLSIVEKPSLAVLCQPLFKMLFVRECLRAVVVVVSFCYTHTHARPYLKCIARAGMHLVYLK